MQLSLRLIVACSLATPAMSQAQALKEDPFRKISPLDPKLRPLPLHEVRPEGWLRNELRKNLDGFTGHLDSLAPDLVVRDDIYGKDRLTRKVKSKSVGAVAEEGDWQVQYLWWNSETQSNWLDGFVRTAVLLDDRENLSKAKVLIDRLLATQDADGYIGIYDPELRYHFDNENGELWSKATLYRALLGWYDHTKEPRVLEAVRKAVDNVMKSYPIGASHPFHSVNPNAGGLTHGLVFTDVLEKLFGLTGDRKYMDYCLFLYRDFSDQQLNEDAQYRKLIDAGLPLKGHGVHTYEHLRPVIAAYQASGNPALKGALDHFLAKIDAATCPSGGPVGDEFIGGRPGHADIGYEYCSLHELLSGWVSLIEKSAKGEYGDKAERIFFNAVMGNTHPTESAICYLKQDNVFQLTGGRNGDTTDVHQTRYRYSPVHREAAVCCVPNAGRVVPYFIQNMWMKDDKGLVATLLGPCELSTRLGPTTVTIKETTEYPFGNSIRFVVSSSRPAEFPIRIRKPGWAVSVSATMPYREEAGMLVFIRKWGAQQEFRVSFGSKVVKKELAGMEVFFESGPFVLCRELPGGQAVTKVYGIAGLRESVYRPLAAARYHYDGEDIVPVPDAVNRFRTGMVDPATGKREEVILVPMAGTILRQVSFSYRK